MKLIGIFILFLEEHYYIHTKKKHNIKKIHTP